MHSTPADVHEFRKGPELWRLDGCVQDPGNRESVILRMAS